MGKALMLVGGVLLLVGVLLVLLERLPGAGGGFGWLGKLPGDIVIKREHFSLYLPVTTSILISVVLSLLLYLLMRR
ncbi:MAG: DUF2905 domain-containing protein [Nitrospirota bacterium]|nr:DUF2905 domain-containing protein [Nitrospirota bacterium]